ncbi:Rib/alpha-like domain-containing protein [Lactobacillus delbrueckii subsp. bulgaricus]
MKMKLSRILTLIVALGLLGSAVETIPSSVQPAKVAAAQKKTAKKRKTKKSTSKSKKKSVKKASSKSKKKTTKKTTSKSKKKPVKKPVSKSKKKTVKKATSKSKKKAVKKTTSKPKKKSVKKTTSKPKKKSVKKTTSKPKKTVKKPTSKSTTKSTTNAKANQPSKKPSTDQPADKPENSSSVKESKDADHYKPIAGEPDVGVAVGDPLPWGWLISNENELPSGTKLKFDKEPDLNKVGTYYIKVIAQYPDGSENSSDTIQVRVRPKTDAEIYEPIVKDGEGFTGNYWNNASELVTNADALPKGTEFYFDSKVDYGKTGVYSATITAYYPDGSRDVTRPVTVKIISPLDVASIEASEVQSSPNDRYLMLKVTNKSDKTLNFRASMNAEDTHGKEICGMKGEEYGPVAPNQSIILYGGFWDEKPYYYGHINYQFYATDTDHKSANSDLKVEVTKNKGFGYDIKATNIGTKKIYYPSVDVFLFKDGKVIYEHETLMEPDDADGLQPGESITKSFQSDDYDDVELSCTSSYDK